MRSSERNELGSVGVDECRHPPVQRQVARAVRAARAARSHAWPRSAPARLAELFGIAPGRCARRSRGCSPPASWRASTASYELRGPLIERKAAQDVGGGRPAMPGTGRGGSSRSSRRAGTLAARRDSARRWPTPAWASCAPTPGCVPPTSPARRLGRGRSSSAAPLTGEDPDDAARRAALGPRRHRRPLRRVAGGRSTTGIGALEVAGRRRAALRRHRARRRSSSASSAPNRCCRAALTPDGLAGRPAASAVRRPTTGRSAACCATPARGSAAVGTGDHLEEVTVGTADSTRRGRRRCG